MYAIFQNFFTFFFHYYFSMEVYACTKNGDDGDACLKYTLHQTYYSIHIKMEPLLLRLEL